MLIIEKNHVQITCYRKRKLACLNNDEVVKRGNFKWHEYTDDYLNLASAHPLLTRTRLISCHDPHVSGDLSAPSLSPFASPELHQPAATTGCFNLLSPPQPHSRGGVPEVAAFLSPPFSQLQPQPGPSSQSSARWMGRASASSGSSVMSEYSTADINRDLELLTEKVTKLAIEGE
ncbi:hypothetical protein ACTXT7_011014 [Hymenolepis weldensis]